MSDEWRVGLSLATMIANVLTLFFNLKTLKLLKQAQKPKIADDYLNDWPHLTNPHDPQCDVNPKNLTWKRRVEKGDTARVCGVCLYRLEFEK